jgi:uncharacterized protein YndB with AHSA1/START domain
MTPDRIEKHVVLKAPRTRVWKALTDTKEFGTWFGFRFATPFAPGAQMRGTIVPTQVDPEIAKAQEPYAGRTVTLTIEEMEAPHRFSFRWHPHDTDETKDNSAEPTTLVVFTLEETKEGTLLTVIESGFDRIPLARRAEAFEANEGGWGAQMVLISKFLAPKTGPGHG